MRIELGALSITVLARGHVFISHHPVGGKYTYFLFLPRGITVCHDWSEFGGEWNQISFRNLFR